MERRRLIAQPGEAARIAWIAFFLVLTLRVLRFFPGIDVIESLWLTVGAFYLIGPYIILNKVRSGFVFSAFELYVLFLIVVMPVVASMAAANVFGQPLYYGLGAQRGVMFCVGALYLINAYRRGTISIATIENAFVFLSWGTLCLFTAMTLFLDPSAMPGQGTFVKGGYILKARFNFNLVFIVFGFIYYGVRGYMRKNVTQYALSLPFLLYVFIIDTGRAAFIAMLLAVMLLALRYGSFKRNIIFSLRATIGAVLTVFIVYSANSVYVLTYLKRLSDAFVVLFLGSNVSDVSANQRILEALTAFPYISKHWLLGCGRISSLWSGGYTGVMGKYFFPSDIGMIGVLFMYGFLGSLVFLVQFYFSRRFARGIPLAWKHDVFVAAVTGYLWYYMIHSIVAGLFVHYLEAGLFMTAVLYCARIDAASPAQMSDGERT